MTARFQDTPNLAEDGFEISKKSAELFPECTMIENQCGEQTVNLRMSLKPAVRGKFCCIAKANVVPPACQVSRRVPIHPAHRHAVCPWVIDCIEIRGRGNNKGLTLVLDDRQWLPSVVRIETTGEIRESI